MLILKIRNKGRMKFKQLVILLIIIPFIGVVLSCFGSDSGKSGNMNQVVTVIPYPESVILNEGSFKLDHGMVININDETLAPYAEVFLENIFKLTGIQPKIKSSAEEGEGIILKINPGTKKSQYRIKVANSILIEAGTVQSLINGCYSFLQLVNSTNEGYLIPKLEIIDNPGSQYRGLMIDLARNWHNVKIVLQLIDLAAFYKLNYVQLHFTDDQSYTLPSKYFPKLPTKNRHYSFEDIRLFEEYAHLRGISIIPEIDVPGHSTSLVKAYPNLFGIKGIKENPRIINMGKEEVYQALEKLIIEINGVFSSSPYFHIGGDEAVFHMLDQDPDVRSYMAKHSLGEDIHELYRHFIVRMNDIVKSHGKQLCVWEGFRKSGDVKIPKDIVVFEFETLYYLPYDLINDGYTVVNASWKPLYVVNEKKWSSEDIFRWNMYRWEHWVDKIPAFNPIQCEESPKVIGGQICAWEQTQEIEFPSLRKRLPAFAERVWSPTKGKSYTDFLQRMEKTDLTLSKLTNNYTQDTLKSFGK